MTRDEFQQQLWSGSSFGDFDHGLNAAMNRLRQVLGDSAEQPRYIETLPGKGYRFIAPVLESEAKPALMMPPIGEARAGAAKPEKPQILLWAVAGSLVAGALLGLLIAKAPPARPLQPLRFAIPPPEGFAFQPASARQSFALSPDGKHIAFTAADSSGVFQAFLRDLDSIQSHPIPDSFGSYNLFWAPDSASLFLSVRGKLRRQNLRQDSYQEISDLPAITLNGELVGSDVMISARLSNFLVPASGGRPHLMKEWYPWPQLLPDGKTILYSLFDSQTGHRRIRAAKPDNPNGGKDLLETDSRAIYAPSVGKPGTGYLVSVRGGNLLAYPFDPAALRVQPEPLAIVSRVFYFLPSGAADFSVSNNGLLAYQRYVSRSQLAWVSRTGAVLRMVGPANVNVKEARLSPDGKRIAATIFDAARGMNELWLIDDQSNALRRIPEPGTINDVIWSPDGSRLAFSMAYDTPPRLFVRGLGEQDATEAVSPEFRQDPTDWSGDGRWIVWGNTMFAEMENEMRGEVWVSDMRAKGRGMRVSNPAHHESDANFSPDGRWLAFTSDESGRTELYLQAFEASGAPRLVGERYRVSRQGVVRLRWRRDGKELFYLGWDGRVYGVTMALGPKPRIGEPEPLFEISLEARSALHSSLGFDVSEDGQRFLIPMVLSKDTPDLVVIQNWEAGALKDGAVKR